MSDVRFRADRVVQVSETTARGGLPPNVWLPNARRLLEDSVGNTRASARNLLRKRAFC